MQRARDFNVYCIFSNTRVGMYHTVCSFTSETVMRYQTFQESDLFCGRDVLEVVDIEVTHEDEPLGVVGVVLQQLLQVGHGIQGALQVVHQHQCHVKQSTAEIGLQLENKGASGTSRHVTRLQLTGLGVDRSPAPPCSS